MINAYLDSLIQNWNRQLTTFIPGWLNCDRNVGDASLVISTTPDLCAIYFGSKWCFFLLNMGSPSFCTQEYFERIISTYDRPSSSFPESILHLCCMSALRLLCQFVDLFNSFPIQSINYICRWIPWEVTDAKQATRSAWRSLWSANRCPRIRSPYRSR